MNSTKKEPEIQLLSGDQSSSSVSYSSSSSVESWWLTPVTNHKPWVYSTWALIAFWLILGLGAEFL